MDEENKDENVLTRIDRRAFIVAFLALFSIPRLWAWIKLLKRRDDILFHHDSLCASMCSRDIWSYYHDLASASIDGGV
jgi:hypothetical protein